MDNDRDPFDAGFNPEWNKLMSAVAACAIVALIALAALIWNML